MTLRKALRAVGTAILYFCIYYGWNLAVVFAASFGVAFDVMMAPETMEMIASFGDISELDPEVMASMMMPELVERTMNSYLDFVSKYAVHLTIVSSILTVLTYIVIFAIRKKSFKEKIGLRRISPVSGIAMFLFGACLNVFVSVFLSVIPLPEAWVTGYADSTDMLLGQTGILMTVMVGVLAPIFEEIVFRGMCYNSLKDGMPMLAAMILSSWGFGMMHVGVLWVLYATVIGLVFAWAYEKHRSILAPVLAHAGFNLTGQLISAVPEVSDGVYFAMMAVSGLACVAIAVYVTRTSQYKIEYLMPETVTEHSGNGNNNNEGEQ